MSSLDRLDAHRREQAGELFRMGRTCLKAGKYILMFQLLLDVLIGACLGLGGGIVVSVILWLSRRQPAA